MLKRIVGALLVAVLLVLLVSCGIRSTDPSAAPSPSPTVAATSRDARNEPVRVDETYANAQMTQPTAAPDDTPATGDATFVYAVGTVGLIVFCSAGLLLLKRI